MENEIQNCGAASLQVQNKWVNKGKNRCHWYSKALLQVQQREESLKDVSIWYSKAHLTLFLYLKQRSRIQESSSAPLLFFATEMVLKISWIRYEINKVFYTDCTAFVPLLFLFWPFNCKKPKRRRFDPEYIYKKHLGLNRVCPGRPGPGWTYRVDQVSPGQFLTCFLLRPGPATDMGRPGPGSTCRVGPGFKTLHRPISFAPGPKGQQAIWSLW